MCESLTHAARAFFYAPMKPQATAILTLVEPTRAAAEITLNQSLNGFQHGTISLIIGANDKMETVRTQMQAMILTKLRRETGVEFTPSDLVLRGELVPDAPTRPPKPKPTPKAKAPATKKKG